MADVTRGRLALDAASLLERDFGEQAPVLDRAVYAGDLAGGGPGGECRRGTTRRVAREAEADDRREGA